MDVQFFLDQGYWRSPSQLDASLVQRMLHVVDDHMARRVEPLRVNAHGEPCRLDHLLERDAVFIEAVRSEPVRSQLTQLLGERSEVLRHRHNHATRNAVDDIPLRLHRDIQQWSQPLVSVFFYLEEATVENGCTVVVPGSHRLPYAGPQSGGGGGNWADEHDEYRHIIGQELPVPMPKGGILFVNSLCFHSVGNGSPKVPSRKSCVFACRALDELRTLDHSPDALCLWGRPRKLANDDLIVSGSLRRSIEP